VRVQASGENDMENLDPTDKDFPESLEAALRQGINNILNKDISFEEKSIEMKIFFEELFL